MKLKYVGKITPINLYRLEGSGKVVTGQVFEVDAQYAVELMARFNVKGKKEKFVEAGSEKVTKVAKEKKPASSNKEISLEI